MPNFMKSFIDKLQIFFSSSKLCGKNESTGAQFFYTKGDEYHQHTINIHVNTPNDEKEKRNEKIN